MPKEATSKKVAAAAARLLNPPEAMQNLLLAARLNCGNQAKFAAFLKDVKMVAASALTQYEKK